MIFGYPALLLHLLTILILGMITGTVMTSLLVGLSARRLPAYCVATRRNLLWLFGFFPLISGLAAIFLSFIPEWLPHTDFWLADIIHWHHAYLFSPASWHGVFLLFCLVALLAMLAWSGWKGASHIRHKRLLRLVSGREEGGLAELDASVPMAFVAGFWRPKAYITKGLASQVNMEERRVISLHEGAHIRHRDPLIKFIFSFLVCLYPVGVRRFLQAEFELMLEQIADESVVRREPSPAMIAQVLLKVERISASFNESSVNKDYSHFARHAVERRVHHLLGVSDYRSLPVISVGVIAVFAVLFSAAGVDLVHHFFETFFLH